MFKHNFEMRKRSLETIIHIIRINANGLYQTCCLKQAITIFDLLIITEEL